MVSSSGRSVTNSARPGILLLQVRGQSGPEEQERRCFERACGIEPGEMAFHNLVETPRLDWSDVESADVMILGGAGDHTATRDYFFTPFLNEVLERWIESGRPFFGSCYGHHVLAKLYGSKLEIDPRREEIGSFEIELTEAGRGDELLGQMPRKFWAQLGHHDSIVSLPPTLIELASSERCRYQAVRVKDRMAFGTQFHPEMDSDEMMRRLEMYRESYVSPELGLAGLEKTLRPSPEACTLLQRFLALSALALPS